MMHIIRLSFFVVVGMFLVGCAVHEKIEQSWIGQPLDELYFSWGPPAREKILKDGRIVASYEHGVDTPYWCKVHVFADSSGFILKFATEGIVGGCNQLFYSKKEYTQPE